MSKKLATQLLLVIFLVIILLFVSSFSLFVGPTNIPLKKFFEIISRGKGTTEYSILFEVRLPRIILGFAIGSTLSLVGVILQGIFRNPLVEPYTLGISGGSALGVCLNIVIGGYKKFGIISLPLSGFFGAIFVTILVYSLSIKRGELKTSGLLLTGVMISFISSSLLMLIMSVAKVEEVHGILFWIMGSLEEPNITLVKFVFFISIFSLIFSYLFCFDLNALLLGEEEAIHLGVNVERIKKIFFILTSLLTGTCVSVAGIIGFVGLVVPHIVRLYAGTDYRILLLSSFLLGSIFLIVCDTISRTIISPMELPVGVITGIVGGSLFIYVFTKRETRNR
jgi:iron complex transport system permease protein